MADAVLKGGSGPWALTGDTGHGPPTRPLPLGEPVSAPTLPIEPQALRIDDLLRRARSYLSQDQLKDLRRAYRFGAEAHEGQQI